MTATPPLGQKSAAPGPLERARAIAHGHAVRFFDPRAYPAEMIAAHLADGLSRQGGALLFATPGHQAEVLHALERTVDVMDHLITGALFLGEAEAKARAIVDRGRVSTRTFDLLVGSAVRRVVERGGPVRIYGEIVDVLAGSGDYVGALQIEELWNAELARHQTIELLCGYSREYFVSGERSPALARICAEHASIEFAPELVKERLPEKNTELATRTRRFREHLGRLQNFTSALLEARTLDEIGELVSRELRAVFGAEFCALTVASEGNRALGLVCPRAVDGDDSPFEALPLTVVFETGVPERKVVRNREREVLGGKAESAMICVPLSVGGQRIGAFGMRHAVSPLMADDHVLFFDYAKQVALAVGRAESYERAQRERRRAEEAESRAASAGRVKEEFLAMLGHELRNPLAPILSAVELMEQRADGALARERRIIERQVKHMARLVEDLLDVSRIARGNVELRLVSVELSHVVADAVEMASPFLEERSHQLVTSVPSGLLVRADPSRLAQVIANLLTNAAKYTPPKGVVTIDATTNDGQVSLIVRDDGIGIDAKLLPYVFDLFVQARQSVDRPYGGLGLGLAIARNLVTMHGGTLRAHSEGPGCGSAFTIELPLASKNSREERSNVQPLRPPTSQRRILIVDDNWDAATVLGEVLTASGHSVRVVHDGLAALRLLPEFKPEIALLDLGLPIMNGHELARQLRTLLGVDCPKLVAITGYGDQEDRRRSLEAGFDKHLVKPVDVDRLVELIATLLPEAPSSELER